MVELTQEMMNALVEEFEVEDIEDIDAEVGDLIDEINIEGQDYKVMTDEEADDAVVEHVRELAWAFNPSFLSGYTGIDDSVFEVLSKQYENANEAIISLIETNGTLEDFADEAVRADGRGHFLSGYDGVEVEVTTKSGDTFYLYAD